MLKHECDYNVGGAGGGGGAEELAAPVPLPLSPVSARRNFDGDT